MNWKNIKDDIDGWLRDAGLDDDTMFQSITIYGGAESLFICNTQQGAFVQGKDYKSRLRTCPCGCGLMVAEDVQEAIESKGGVNERPTISPPQEPPKGQG